MSGLGTVFLSLLLSNEKVLHRYCEKADDEYATVYMYVVFIWSLTIFLLFCGIF